MIKPLFLNYAQQKDKSLILITKVNKSILLPLCFY